MSESENSLLRETPGDAALEFPDWSGQLPHRSHVSNDQWLAYCRANLPKLRARSGYAQARQQHGIPVEFRL